MIQIDNIEELFYKRVLYYFTKEKELEQSSNLCIDLINAAYDNKIENIELKNKLLGFDYYFRYHIFGAPWLLHFCITDFCQLKCKHCYFGDYSRLHNTTIDEAKIIFNKFEDIRNKFISIGYKSINYKVCNIAGGEPLANPDIVPIIKLISKDSFHKTKLLTNGWDFSKDVLYALRDSSETPVYQVSLDGSEEIHDYIRAKDSFKRAIRTMQYVKKYCPDVQLWVAFNASQYNYKEIINVTKIAKEMGCNRIFYDRYVPCAKNLFLKVLTMEQYKEYIDMIKYCYENYNSDSFEVYTDRSMQLDLKHSYYCFAAVQDQFCTANGDRYICSRYQYGKTGNLITDDVDYLVKEAIKAEVLTQQIPYECFNCVHMPNCRGGMRCLGWAMHGTHNEKDIHCYKYIQKKDLK